MSSFEKINLLNTLFYVALAVAGLFLILSVILFFAFNVPEIFMIKTGRAKKRSIEKMMKVNSETGRLNIGSKESKGISSIFGSSTDLSSVKTDILTAPQSGSLANTAVEGSPPAARQESTFQETTILSEAAGDIGETTVLQQPYEPMSPVAAGPEQTPEEAVDDIRSLQPDTSYGEFEIVRFIIKTHTNEIIN